MFIVILFFLIFSLSLEAGESGSRDYRDRFGKLPPAEREGRDSGPKGGKTGRKKKADIAVLPWSKKEDTLALTLEAESGQLISLSHNGLSGPGSALTWDPDSLSLASSKRGTLFDHIRAEFVGETVFLNETGLTQESSDLEIKQFVGLKADQFLGVDDNHPAKITAFNPFSAAGGSLNSRNPIAVVVELSQVAEDATYQMMFPILAQLNPVTAMVPPQLIAQYAPSPRYYALFDFKEFANSLFKLNSGEQWHG